MPVTRAELERRKKQEFDPILNEIVAIRIIHGRQLTRARDYQPILDTVSPIVNLLVNPRVVDQIIGATYELPLQVPEPAKRKFYTPEDRVRFCLRKLVEFYHGREDKRLVRRLTEACLLSVTAIVNSEEFNEAFLAA